MSNLISDDNYHYFFGFHDLIAWNAKGNKLAALQIEEIISPPSLERPCNIGYIKDGKFIKLGKTYAYNFPQGARQQWLGESDLLIVNDLVGDVWGTRIYDTNTNKLIDTISKPTHILQDDGWAYGLDYSRLHRLGGYGYTGLKDISKIENCPANSGIIKHNLFTKKHELLVSIKEVANYKSNTNSGKNHYLTHLVLNPSKDRIAFLHRCKLNDGGETTRLMTIGTNGENLRCLASGFLSHFDWKDNENIIIWGRTGTSIEKLRNNKLIKIIPPFLMRGIKGIIKSFLKKRNNNVHNSKESMENWLLLSDTNEVSSDFFAKEVLKEDGHPMFCPSNRDWMICDTYPNNSGIRELFLFQFSTQKKIVLGTFQMIFEKPNIKNILNTLDDVEKSVIKSFSLEKMAFYRSGLHCDLHPRWNFDGSRIAFDSIHEGKRKIYELDVSEIVK